MSSKAPPTLEHPECMKLLDMLLNNTSTSKKAQKSVRNYCMACLMLDAGLRVGELVSLRMADLYFNKEPVRTIFIKPGMTKNKVAHSIPVSQRLHDALANYLASDILLDPNLSDRFAFLNESTGRPVTTRQVERIICAAGMKALGRPVHPHVLRHTVASKWMRVTSSSTVQQLLGHKYLSSTQIYCHPNSEDRRRAIEQASRLPAQPPESEQPHQDETAEVQESSPGPQPASVRPHQPASQW